MVLVVLEIAAGAIRIPIRVPVGMSICARLRAVALKLLGGEEVGAEGGDQLDIGFLRQRLANHRWPTALHEIAIKSR